MKARFEAALIRIAIYILSGRNVARAMVVSRRDNNEMWGMAERLQDIAARIQRGYK